MRALLLLGLAACLSKPSAPGGGNNPDGGGTPDTPMPPTGGFVKLAVGDNHACAIDATQHLYCWGRAEQGQLGKLEDQTPKPTLASQEAGWTDVALGAYHSCGIINGAARCWGNNSVGQSANGTIFDPIDLSGFAPASLFVRDGGTCALDAGGKLMCWGGVGLNPTNPEPFMIGADANAIFTQVAFDDDHGCGLRADGIALCWGGNGAHQIDSSNDDMIPPAMARAINSRPFSYIAVGSQNTCGIYRDDGSIQCFGDSSNPMWPTGGVDTSRKWTSLAMSFDFMCGLAAGELRCWGYTQFGQTATGIAYGQINVPAAAAMSGVSSVGVGDDFGCALTEDHGVSCWGQNRYGNLGNGQIARAFTPVEIFGTDAAQYITVGLDHACFSLEFGNATYCWGDNRQHQVVPDGGTPFVTTPVAIGKNLFQVSAGRTHTCGIIADSFQHAFCWGSNDDQRLGTTQSTTQHEVPSLSFSWIAAGPTGTCGISAGKLYCWGIVPGVASPSTTQPQTTNIGAGVQLTQVMIGDSHVIITDGKSVWGFGNGCAATGNDSTDIAVGNAIKVSLPGSPTSIDIAVGVNGGFDSCALTNDKRLVCWGKNEQGELALDTQPTCYLPFQRMSDVADIGAPDASHLGMKVAMAGDHGCTISTDSDAVCWGDDNEREIGTRADNTTEDQLLVPFVGVTWGEIAMGGTVGCGIRTMTGHVECWGTSYYGELGNGTMFVGKPTSVLP